MVRVRSWGPVTVPTPEAPHLVHANTSDVPKILLHLAVTVGDDGMQQLLVHDGSFREDRARTHGGWCVGKSGRGGRQIRRAQSRDDR
jgi:hypothetical protein